MTRPTPGPGQAVDVFGTLPYVVSAAADQVICERIFNGNGNVRLIAAAPDLLEACERIMLAHDEYMADAACQYPDAIIDLIQRHVVPAVAKAKGGA